MKTSLISVALSALALMATPQLSVAQSGDITQIKAVIERETTAWINRDTNSMADCWANVPEAGNLVGLVDGRNTVYFGQNPKLDMPQSLKKSLDGQKPTGETFQNSDYLIRVKGDAAFAQFEQVVTAPDGKKEYAHETRYLEKMDDKWKIIHVGAVFYKPAK